MPTPPPIEPPAPPPEWRADYAWDTRLGVTYTVHRIGLPWDTGCLFIGQKAKAEAGKLAREMSKRERSRA